MSLEPHKSKAADLLLRARLLQQHQYDRVLVLVEQTNDRAEDVLVDNDLLSEADLLKALSGIYRTHFVSTERLAKADIPRATVQMIPRRVAETMTVFPVLFDRESNVLSVVTPDPDNADMLREIKLVSGARDVKAFVARPAAVRAAIRKHHAGDVNAFDVIDKSTSILYDFGQKALAETMSPKETFRGVANTISPQAARAVPVATLEPAMLEPVPVSQVPGVRRARAVPAEEQAARGYGRPSLEAPPLPKPGTAGPPPLPARARRGTVPAGSNMLRADMPSAPPPPPRPGSSPAISEPPPSEATRNVVLSNDTTVELLTVMVSLLENTRQELRGHSSQVARLLRRVAERMNLDRNDTYAVVVAAHIHDIGKMGQVHLTALNCSEYDGHRAAALKAHDTPLRLLEAVRLPATIKNAVFHMYERFDGKGFPDKLVGKEIPLGARLLSVADTYADLTQNSRNPFRKVLGPTEAIDVLMQHKGTIFDPGILDLVKAMVLGEDMKAKLLANRYVALVVDPDPEESTLLELRMFEQGFDVKTVRSADAARKALSAEGADFDLVVAEMGLPDGDGLALLSEVRKTSWGRDVPWVVHTHKQGRTEAQRAFELGAMDFVAKPVQADVLVAKLKAMLDQQSTKLGAKGVSGSLREMGLPDIVQVLFHGRKTGKLNVRSGTISGEIHFLTGNIANALLDDLEGADAFYAMLKFVEGDFALDPSFAPPKRIIEESSEALLLEGMRRMDEGI